MTSAQRTLWPKDKRKDCLCALIHFADEVIVDIQGLQMFIKEGKSVPM